VIRCGFHARAAEVGWPDQMFRYSVIARRRFFADVAIHGLGVVGQQWIATPFGFAMTVFETGFSPD